MIKLVSKLGLGKVWLMFFIYLCSLLMCENVLSRKLWQKDNMTVYFNQKERFITINFLFYDYWALNYSQYACLSKCDFFYSEDNSHFYYLMNVSTSPQEEKTCTWIKMNLNNPGAHIYLLNSYTPAIGTMLPDVGTELKVKVKPTQSKNKEGQVFLETKRSYLSVKWKLPQSCKQIKSIRIFGDWLVFNEKPVYKIKEDYKPVIVRSNSKTMKKSPSVLASEISNEVKVIKDAEAITVTGVEPGENIKVYTVLGEEVKSVVANDDVVNIKLAKNQQYIVKTGLASYKVALCVP